MARRRKASKGKKSGRTSKALRRATDAILSKMRKRVSRCVSRCAGIGTRHKRR